MQHSSGVEVSSSGTSHVPILTQDGAKEESKPTTQGVTQVVTSASATAVTEDIQAQLEKDKRLIYGHPLFPLMAQLFEKCEQATQSTDPPTSASFDVDIEEFVHQQDRTGKPFFSNDPEIDNLMVKAIQVLRIHLLELEKVNELCKDFCHRYITCLKGKMHSDILLRDERQPGTPFASSQLSQEGQGSAQGPEMTPPHQVTQQVQASPQQVHPVTAASVGSGTYIIQPNTQSAQSGSAQLQQAQFQTMLNQAGQVVYAPVIPQGVMTQQGLVTQGISGTVQLQNTPQQGVGAQSVVPVIHGSTPISHIGIPSSGTSEQQNVTSISYAASTPTITSAGDEYDDVNELLNKRKPKRGVLPKHATNIMRSWLFQHIVHPYPTEDEKRMIAAQTNLTLLQVNNWFINARRRILQPMLDASNPDPSTKTKKVKTQSRPSTQRFWPESLANLSSTNTAKPSSDIGASTELTPTVPVQQITLSGETVSSMIRVHHSSSSSPQVEGLSNGEGDPLEEDGGNNGSELSSNDGGIGLGSDEESS
ncbi:homeobox protein PKNOX2-like isoform X2 [Acanthaster planci]|uniref:Homeobox protein PKNOX2-like isoform X2 n=1 Tax=Acanthaster planci TaxID=133434 RepID=A0A8B7ZYT6_ACAPL|nr:homeobox protein PKNOX2-like isoform X2 [Acanthaster planci]